MSKYLMLLCGNKLFVLTFCFSAFGAYSLSAQDYIHEGNIELSNQIQVNNFLNTNEKTTIIKGNLLIGNYANKTDINNLIPLTHLLIVDGVVTIVNTDITSLKGLHKLLEVRYLVIAKNDKLSSLFELKSLEKIYGALQIDDNPLLQDLTGLEMIDSIGRSQGQYLQIFNNDGLKNLKGIENIKSISGNLHISQNDSLNSIQELTNLNQIGESLIIRNNPMLQKLDGLNNLNHLGFALLIENMDNLKSFHNIGKFPVVNQNFTVRNSPLITDFSGLENLTEIKGNLTIEENAELTSLEGLENVNSIGSIIFIENNPRLEMCKQDFICNAIKNGRAVEIYNNSAGCSTKAEVSKACGVVSVENAWESPVHITFKNDRIHFSNHTVNAGIIVIYHLMGKPLYKYSFNGPNDVSFKTNLPAGIYIVSLQSGNKTFFNKIMKP